MKAESRMPLVLAGDVGGTKTVLGLFSVDPVRPKTEVETSFASREASDLETLIERFLQQQGVEPAAACFGVAGPVTDGECRATNLPWRISENDIQARFGFPRVVLLNDLTATAHAIDLLRAEELYALNPTSPKSARVGLVAPGTGLGMALLLGTDQNRRCVPSEGGHMDFAPVHRNDLGLWEYLHRRFGHVSVERLVSGPGLVNIYSYLKDTGAYEEPEWLARQMESEDSAKAISQAALADKALLAVEALARFASILGSVSGNLALIGLTTGGIYLGGGIAPQILPELSKGGFLKAFSDKGRFRDLVAKIPVRVILNPRAALLGAARCGLEAVQEMRQEQRL